MSWLKLYRSVLDSSQFKNPLDLKVWVWILCKASITDRNITIKTGIGVRSVALKRGQLIFGRHSAATELDILGSTLYKIIKRLEDDQCIKIESGSQFSIITVCNYADFQDYEEIEDLEVIEKVSSKRQPNVNQVSGTWQPRGSHVAHNKNVYNVKKVDKEEVSQRASPPGDILPASPKKVKKEKAPPPAPRLHWQQLIDTWFTFYSQHHAGEEPNFKGRNPAYFAKLYELLEARAKKKGYDWTLENSTKALNLFLELAWSDEWLKSHFLLSNLVDQFDAVYAREALRLKSKNTAPVGPKSFDDEIKFLVCRHAEGGLDPRVITPDLYDRMSGRGYLPLNFAGKFPGQTIEDKKVAAVLGWIAHQNEKTI